MKIEQSSSTVLQTVKASEVTLQTGEDALALLEEEGFQANWDTLYNSCPWATIFQSRTFVTTWYRIYRPEYSPIIVTSTYGGKLTGLLTLTASKSDIRKKKGHIVGAGKYDAAYQGWLTEAEGDEHFIKEALSKVLRAFPSLIIHFRYINSHVPLQWINESSWKHRCLLESHISPLMEVNDPSVSKLYHKTTFRNCSNRLKKLGEVQFDHITSSEQLSATIEDFMVMYDFRQGAMFNRNHFLDDPLKAKLFWAFFEQGLLYVAELKVKDHLFASVSGVADKGWLYFAGGFITHSPFRAKYYSPGFVQLLKLSQLFVQEGMTGIDLSPGGDFYKDRLSTKQVDVYELLITKSPLYYIKRQLRKKYFEILEKAGVRPMSKMIVWRKRKYLLKEKLKQAKQEGIFTYVVSKINHLIKPPKTKVYTLTTPNHTDSATIVINKNSLRDMLGFESKGISMSRWEFLEDAMTRFENGECSYSYSEGGKMLACVWVSEKQKAKEGPNSPSTEKNIFLQHFYCHTLGHAKQKEFITAAVLAATQEGKNEMLYAITTDKNKTLCTILEDIGFTLKDIPEVAGSFTLTT